MASLIHEGTRIGQGQRNEQVSELTMRSEPFPPGGREDLPPSTTRTNQPLAQRPLSLHPDYERTPNFQRASCPLIGATVPIVTSRCSRSVP